MLFADNHWLGSRTSGQKEPMHDLLLSSTRANAYYDLFKRVIKLVVIVATRGLYSPMHFTFSVYSALIHQHSRQTHTLAHQFFGSAKRVAQATSSANMGGHVFACCGCGAPLAVTPSHARSGFWWWCFLDDEDARPDWLYWSVSIIVQLRGYRLTPFNHLMSAQRHRCGHSIDQYMWWMWLSVDTVFTQRNYLIRTFLILNADGETHAVKYIHSYGFTPFQLVI